MSRQRGALSGILSDNGDRTVVHMMWRRGNGNERSEVRGHVSGRRISFSQRFRQCFQNDAFQFLRQVSQQLTGWLRFVGVVMATWQHSTMSKRIAFLHTVLENPLVEQRFQRRITCVRWGLALGLLAVIGGLSFVLHESQ